MKSWCTYFLIVCFQYINLIHIQFLPSVPFWCMFCSNLLFVMMFFGRKSFRGILRLNVHGISEGLTRGRLSAERRRNHVSSDHANCTTDSLRAYVWLILYETWSKWIQKVLNIKYDVKTANISSYETMKDHSMSLKRSKFKHVCAVIILS